MDLETMPNRWHLESVVKRVNWKFLLPDFLKKGILYQLFLKVEKVEKIEIKSFVSTFLKKV